MLNKLTPEQELAYLKTLHGPDRPDRLIAVVVEQFTALQQRAQTLLGLVTICLTISGFSGPSIAASSRWACASLGAGLVLVLTSAVVTLAGPLQLRWATQWKGKDTDDSLIGLLRNRNVRTIRYHTSFWLLVLGLCGYVGSLIGYLMSLQR